MLPRLNNRTAIFFSIGLTIGLVGCAMKPTINIRKVVGHQIFNEPDSEMHAVGKLISPTGYHFISASRLNPIKPTTSTPKLSFKDIAIGRINSWHWKIDIEKQLLPSWHHYLSYKGIHKLHKKFGKNPVNRLLPALPGIVSWRDAFTRFKNVARLLVGHAIPPLDINIFFVSRKRSIRNQIERHSLHAIPLSFYFSFPGNSKRTPAANGARASSLSDSFRTLAHEYLHALIASKNIAPMPNKSTEEATAYAFQTCMDVAMGGSVLQLDVAPPEGVSIPPPYPSPTQLKNYADNDSPTAKGKILNVLNTEAFLRKETIDRNDYRDKNKLLGLCRAMIQHPHDLTESYYPADKIRPVSYFPVSRKRDSK